MEILPGVYETLISQAIEERLMKPWKFCPEYMKP